MSSNQNNNCIAGFTAKSGNNIKGQQYIDYQTGVTKTNLKV